MKLILLIVILGSCALIALAVVVVLYHHKNKISKSTLMPGEKCRVISSLSPEGSVMINGELWRARSVDGKSIPSDSLVQIVGSADHLLLVDSLDRQ